ncbi:hypothetical protein [Methylacidiphilum kamchatkense]|uniref:hypothetical protein n=1 Tax=Methylacidiphilum kamchatkense TaxID=431057 RepID=UPI00117E3026|nr:hypothetical protein [Methylacidiphilum kamchatkense]
MTELQSLLLEGSFRYRLSLPQVPHKTPCHDQYKLCNAGRRGLVGGEHVQDRSRHSLATKREHSFYIWPKQAPLQQRLRQVMPLAGLQTEMAERLVYFWPTIRT